MSLLPVPVELVCIKQHIAKSVELQQHNPAISYFCKFYAAKLALAVPNRSDDTVNQYLETLIESLEEDKKVLGDNEIIKNNLVGRTYLEDFALKIFINADNAYRAGNATVSTAKAFLASSVFLDTLNLFKEKNNNTQDSQSEDLDFDYSEIQEKIRYAKYKAAEILRALKEGKKPIPIVQDSEFELNSSSNEEYKSVEVNSKINESSTLAINDSSITNGIKAKAESINSTSENKKEKSNEIISSTVVNSSSNHSSPSISKPVINHDEERKTALSTDYNAFSKAAKHAKYAISALQYFDVKTARSNLLEALKLLDEAEEK